MSRKVGEIERFYWDSAAFLAWLLPEPERVPKCREVLEAAAEGECVIVTSALTLAEVIKLKHHPPLREDQEKKIRAFFQNSYILVVELNRFIAEEARVLTWAHNVSPKDAVHIATALRLKIEELHTFDGPLQKLSGKLGNPQLAICEPAARQKRIASQAAVISPSTEPERLSEQFAGDVPGTASGHEHDPPLPSKTPQSHRRRILL